MANHKRKKSKRTVKCTLCTKHRWFGNAKGRFKPKEESERKTKDRERKKSR